MAVITTPTLGEMSTQELEPRLGLIPVSNLANFIVVRQVEMQSAFIDPFDTYVEDEGSLVLPGEAHERIAIGKTFSGLAELTRRDTEDGVVRAVVPADRRINAWQQIISVIEKPHGYMFASSHFYLPTSQSESEPKPLSDGGEKFLIGFIRSLRRH